MERGDVIRDNDPRMPKRELVIVGFEADTRDSWRTVVICEDQYRHRNPRRVRIRADRIFSDSKPRRYGFSLITSGPQPSG
jgi:hypothetical protein